MRGGGGKGKKGGEQGGKGRETIKFNYDSKGFRFNLFIIKLNVFATSVLAKHFFLLHFFRA